MPAFADTTRRLLPARFMAAFGLAASLLLASCGGGGGGDGSAVGGAGTPQILESPASATLIVGQSTGLHVEAAGQGLGFAWEQQRPGGAWEAAAGTATAELLFSDLRVGPVEIGMDDTRYRSVVSNANGSIATAEAQLDVVWGIVNTLDPNTVFDFGPGPGGFGGSADGGTPGGGDGEGAGVGGGLGKTRQVRISVARVADGASLGQALSGANTGLVRVKAGRGAAPVVITLQGTPTGTYYDEGRDAMLLIGADQQLHALVGDFDRHLGVTTLTEGAFRYALNNYLQDPAQVRAGAVPLKRTATAEELARLTPAQIQGANEAVRGEINRLLPSRYALDSISTLPTPVDNTSPAGSIVDNIYGRMQAVVGGLSLAAFRFNPSLANPALTMNAQLADDLTDGVIDGRALDGSSVFGANAAAYDPASLASLLAAAADAQFARFGDGGGTQPTTPPAITRQPFSAVITQGGTALLTVVATGSPLEYQWFGNGVAVPGETKSTLSTTTGGQYFVRVSNSLGTVDSASVTVTVTTTPTSTPPVITTQPASATISCNPTATFSVVASGTNLRYQWFNAAGDIRLQNQTAPSYTTGDQGSYYVVVTNEAGQVRSQNATLTVAPCVTAPQITTQPTTPVTINAGDSATLEVSASGSPLNFQWFNAGVAIANATTRTYTTSVAGTYYVVVSNSAGSVRSTNVVVTVVSTPVITTQPQSVTINPGQTTTLRVVATGLNLTYQWQLNGAPIGGATSASYVTGTPGTYTVVVRNSAGPVTSAAAVVSVSAAPTITTQPQSVAINLGQTTTLTVVASGTGPLTYQWRNANGPIASATSASYTTGAAGSYTVVVSNAAGSVTSSAAVVTINSAPAITTQPQSVTINQGQTTTLSVVATGAGTLTYQWRNAGGNIAGATSSTYTTGAAGTYSVVVTNAAGSTPSSTATVTVIGPPTITTQPQSATIGTGQTATLSVVAAGAAPLTYQWRNANGNITGATSSSYTTGVAGTYSVVVTNAAGSTPSSTATVTVVAPPSITTQPRSVTINDGDTTTLTVVAAGTGTLTYQWRNAGGAITGATSSSYTTGVAGTYSVVVTNAGGSTTSSSATVTVIVPPSISAQPQSVTINSNQTATLRVDVLGTAPFAYQWQRNSGNIGGATASTYTTSTAATYRVLVSNPAGTATSNAATVTVR